jgi:hypothetical protein
MKLLEKELSVNPSEKTELFIKEWMELKKREWELRPREDEGSGKHKMGRFFSSLIFNIKLLRENLTKS